MRNTHSGNNDVSLAQYLVQVLGTGVRQGCGRVHLAAGQQQTQRAAHGNAAAEHHNVLTIPVDAVALHQLNDTVGGAGQRGIQRLRNVQHELAEVGRVQAVSVLLGGDALQHAVGVQVLGQGQLHNVAGARRVVVQLVDLCVELFLSDVTGQVHTDGVNTDLCAVAVLSTHVRAGCGVVTDQDGTQAGSNTLSLERLDALLQLFLDGCGGCVTV